MDSPRLSHNNNGGWYVEFYGFSLVFSDGNHTLVCEIGHSLVVRRSLRSRKI